VTEYPWKETVRVTVDPGQEAEFTLGLRIPAWCRNPEVRINGSNITMAEHIIEGYARIRRVWQAGDTLELRLPMPVERVRSHPEVRQNQGRVALQRGPVVYCLEEADNGDNLEAISLPRAAELSSHYQGELLGGVAVVASHAQRSVPVGWADHLYRFEEPPIQPHSLLAIPYFAWANREPGEMVVWIRESR
jgi:DUF1680 family protein